MADEADMEAFEEATEPSMDSSREVPEENDQVMYKLHEEIDNLNLVLDHLERKNYDIYSQIEALLMSFQQNKAENENDEEDDKQ